MENSEGIQDIFPNIPMKCSFSIPPSESATPMKLLFKDSALKSTLRKSSVKCCKNLFENANKRSQLITSFIDDDCPKREPLAVLNKSLRRSYCAACPNKVSGIQCSSSTRLKERV